MQISTSRRFAPQQLSANQKAAPAKEQATECRADNFTFSDDTKPAGTKILKTVGAIALGVGIGAWAGYNTGGLAGLGGAAVTVVPGAFAGGISAALVAERVGQSDESKVAGAGLWGAVLGGAVGATGGAFLGSQATGLGAAIGLGIVGAATGMLVPS